MPHERLHAEQTATSSTPAATPPVPERTDDQGMAASSLPAVLAPRTVLALQRSAGNQAVTRMVAGGVDRPSALAASESASLRTRSPAGGFEPLSHEIARVGQQRAAGRSMADGPGALLQRQETTSEPEAPAVCEEADPNAAEVAVDAFRAALMRLISGTAFWQRNNLTDYLDSTSGDPRLSLADGQLADILGEAVGNSVAMGGEQLLKAAAKRSPPAILAALGTVVEPVGGTAVGFVLGVLVEVVAGGIFEYLTGKTEIDTASAEVSERLGQAIRDADAVITAGQSASMEALELCTKLIKEQINAATTGPEEVIRIQAAMEEAAASTPQPINAADRSWTQRLLQVWVLEHAANATSAEEGLQVQWESAVEQAFGAGSTLADHPEIFAFQTRAEWDLAGLDHTDQFAALTQEMQQAFVTVPPEMRAEVCQSAFHNRTYTFTSATDPERLFRYIRDRSGMEDRPEEEYLASIRAGTTEIACTLDVGTSDGAVYIDEWNFDVWWDTDKGKAPATHTWFDVWPSTK